ncbi:hypothetical protein FV228_18425 [Methylobacterium sp. WL18]|nr:hypothetical protein FV233_07350 [Methylobacterium sp. WL7]TXN63099.1 hypothetical protein FV228_18425 [Methylobacterium sp. WL18]
MDATAGPRCGSLPPRALPDSRIGLGNAVAGSGAGPLSRAGEGEGEGCDLSGETCPLAPTLSRTGEGARRGFRKPTCESGSPQRGARRARPRPLRASDSAV